MSRNAADFPAPPWAAGAAPAREYYHARISGLRRPYGGLGAAPPGYDDVLSVANRTVAAGSLTILLG
jgi:hypothetical protein